MRAERRRRASAIGVLAALVVGAVCAVALVVVSGYPFTGRAPLGRAADLSPQPLLADSPAVSTSDTQTTSSASPSSSVSSSTSATTTTATTTPSTTTPQPSKAGPAVTSSVPPATKDQGQPNPPANQPPSLAQQVLSRVNQERARVGCQALSEDGRLNSEAQQHSADMARLGRLSIDSYDQRARAAGYPNPGGENVASGYRSADQVMNAWMGNDTQRRNILDCSAVAMGLGLDTNGWYWTQDFGR